MVIHARKSKRTIKNTKKKLRKPKETEKKHGKH